MNCNNCGKEINDGLELCQDCQKADEPVQASVTDENINSEKPESFSLESQTQKKQQKVIDLIKEKAKKIIENYKNFKNLSTKQKIIHIAVPLIIILVLFGSGGESDKERAVRLAVNQVDSQIYGGGEVEIYDAVCVDKDGKGRFIVTVTSERNRFETWWAVLVTLYPDGEHYNAIANYHGGGISQDEWVEEYKTDSDYGWGTKIED